MKTTIGVKDSCLIVISMVKAVFLSSLPTCLSSFWVSSQQKTIYLLKAVVNQPLLSSSVGFSFCHILPFLGIDWGSLTRRTNSKKSAAERKLKKFIRFQALHLRITVLTLHCALCGAMEKRTGRGSVVLAGITYHRTESINRQSFPLWCWHSSETSIVHQIVLWHPNVIFTLPPPIRTSFLPLFSASVSSPEWSQQWAHETGWRAVKFYSYSLIPDRFALILQEYQ